MKPTTTHMLSFASDYMEGAHPAILEKLVATNMEQSAGYGLDEYSTSAKEKIKNACNVPNGEVFFLVGGTQTNALVIKSLLSSYEGVIAADTGHISTHEAGAIELGGHKVLTLPHTYGKISATQITDLMETYWNDENHDHIVKPGMVYISQPTEYGTLYSLEELTAIHKVCENYKLPLYIDGARLAYALGCPENDVTLEDLGRLCDAFYIGGTKCGALFGEALVFTKANTVSHFFTIIKQNGALLAKGRLLGLQFDTLFTNNLYEAIGQHGTAMARKLRIALQNKNYTLAFPSPTNQIFVTLTNEAYEQLIKHCAVSFWERIDEKHVIIRLATSWATKDDDVDALIGLL